MTYNKICGKVKGYQEGSPSAFGDESRPSLDTRYVEGISITLGNPRKHVWTYAVGLSDKLTMVIIMVASITVLVPQSKEEHLLLLLGATITVNQVLLEDLSIASITSRIHYGIMWGV